MDIQFFQFGVICLVFLKEKCIFTHFSTIIFLFVQSEGGGDVLIIFCVSVISNCWYRQSHLQYSVVAVVVLSVFLLSVACLGILSRREAEVLLIDKPIGCFLLRVSATK